MLENVKMLVSNNFIHTFNKWVDFLNSLGYISNWKVLNGRDYGIPQDRSRVFLVSIMNPEIDFVFPMGTKVTTSIEDYMFTKKELGEELYNKLKFAVKQK